MSFALVAVRESVGCLGTAMVTALVVVVVVVAAVVVVDRPMKIVARC